MNQTQFVASVAAYVQAVCAAQVPAVVLNGDGSTINYGLDYLARADVFPRVVATPSDRPDTYNASGKWAQDMGDPTQTAYVPTSFDRLARIDFHIWGQSEQQVEFFVSAICEALTQIAGGVSYPETGYWPQVRPGKTLTAVDGVEYVLVVAANLPVTLATYPAVSGVAPGITTEMDFADGTHQKDP